MTYTIRNAQLSDIPAMAQVELNAGELFKTAGLDQLTGDFASPEFVASFVRSGGAFSAVDENGAVVGFALAFFLDGALHLHEISVDPAHGRKGLGGRLLDAVAEFARTKDCSRITLSTFQDVPWNAPFYERHGYRQVTQENWTPGFHILRDHEQEAGLPVERRCFMEKYLLAQYPDAK